MTHYAIAMATALLILSAGCLAEPGEAPYKRGRDFDPANMEHLLYSYKTATAEQKSISLNNLKTLEDLNNNSKWSSLFKTAFGLLSSYPTPEALVYLGNAYLNTTVDGKNRRELIDNKKINFTTASSYYSAALEYSAKVNMPIPQLEKQTRVKIACIDEYIGYEKFNNPEKCQSIQKVLTDNKI